MNNSNLTEEQIILNTITEDIKGVTNYTNRYLLTASDYLLAINSIYNTLKKAGYIKDDITN
ncbi:hypothetical protein AXI71_gp48 [Lactococcus phage GE1]|uniref:Uncharacterized protein n=1 Tax=Lactococcus phage GE1 TaxID=1698369 RepID=A0A0N9BAV5_9CAUD|nr:hypothetical protein AXI71_gp48 [Lactococcus phage GE1]ALA07002.1 hypothetical protein [Lactococcus phage GE1]